MVNSNNAAQGSTRCTPYIPPTVENWEYYREADGSRVFHVIGVEGFSGDFTQVWVHEWGRPKAGHIPYDAFVKAIETGRLIKFMPEVKNYSFTPEKG